MANGFADNGNSLTCPFGRCDGGGWILGEDNLAYKCDCLEPRLAKARNSGINSVIPARYRGVSFDRPPVTEINSTAVNAVRDWIDSMDTHLDKGTGLWFEGGIGTGKTTLAMLMSKEVLKRGHSVAIYSCPKLLARIRETFNAGIGEETYSELFERLCEVDLLHVDDLGAEKQTEWVLEQLYSLINERYEREKPMVVTTNFDLTKLEEQIGPRTVSRLLQMSHHVLDMPGDDARFIA
ncbi:MAG: ATP-binding protein [Solirubrobacterales bacterium]|nr:ATP-binding protein [Solirubrobacterales bacterium]